MTDIKYPDIKIKLTRRDGNAFVIIGAALKQLKRAKVPAEQIAAFQSEVMSGDYSQLVQTCMRWVDIQYPPRRRRRSRKGHYGPPTDKLIVNAIREGKRWSIGGAVNETALLRRVGHRADAKRVLLRLIRDGTVIREHSRRGFRGRRPMVYRLPPRPKEDQPQQQ